LFIAENQLFSLKYLFCRPLDSDGRSGHTPSYAKYFLLQCPEDESCPRPLAGGVFFCRVGVGSGFKIKLQQPTNKSERLMIVTGTASSVGSSKLPLSTRFPHQNTACISLFSHA